ncbi:MAG TPA: hypothetical protein VKV40_10880 [Ktedonobacteraceae bacterium]|nr:hypothetical protein [Ktedonobacteraceae bacterium]
MMRERMKTHQALYPPWCKKDSPATLAKERDGWRCIDCGRGQRTTYRNADDQLSMVFLHAAHIHPLDPDYEQVEPIEGQRLRARCASCHRRYDSYWKERQAEVEHQITMHHRLLSRFLIWRFLSSA